jgi:hypothetical protein
MFTGESSGWKADVMWIEDRALSRIEFDRRKTIDLPEDIILAKLECIRVQQNTLDFAYLTEWAGELNITELLNEAIVSSM